MEKISIVLLRKLHLMYQVNKINSATLGTKLNLSNMHHAKCKAVFHCDILNNGF